ncbi:hypothetical protein [Mucilaginibacter defluvii]|uniref:hypothetical protein n=1 Tax=Mucilaginibacter defluvii TaxID=1196019 RepID=UPI0031EED20B
MEKQVTGTINESETSKKALFCPHCHNKLSGERVHRGFFVRNFLFWLPIKRYMCYKCSKKLYLWVN